MPNPIDAPTGSYRKTARKPSLLRLLWVIAPLLASCTTTLGPPLRPQAGSGGGAILVDSPEVFDRERLVRDRELQKEWLKKQLNVSDAWFDAVQLSTQSRSLDSSSFSLGVDATPEAGLAVRKSEAEIEDLRRAQEFAELQHQVNIAALQEQLAGGDPADDLLVAVTIPTTTTDSGTSGGGSTSGGQTAAGATPSAAGASASAPATGTSGNTSSPAAAGTGPPAFGAALQGTVSDAPIDRFRDRLAYREIVRQELLENDLDDAHDLHGNTLYRLTFDTTIVPDGTDTSEIAHVQVLFGQAQCKPDSSANRGLLDQFIDQLESFLREESEQLRSALLEDDLSRYDAEIARRARKDEGKSFRADRLGVTAAIFKSAIATKVGNDNTPRSEVEKRKSYTPGFQGATAADVADCMTEKIHRDILEKIFGDVLTVEASGRTCSHTKPPTGSENSTLTITKKSSAEVHKKFCAALAGDRLPKRIEPYAVTPKETVERISDWAVTRSQHERALSLGAALGTVGFETAWDQLQVLENQREAIRRNPLVVGYAQRERAPHADASDTEASRAKRPRVGWLVGPRVSPRYDAPGFDFRHRNLQLPLSTVVSVPGWWTAIRLEVTTDWGFGDSGGDTVQYEIALPGDPSGLLHLLFPRARKPRPFFYTPAPRLEIGTKQTLVIHGEDLWRNPQVFLGEQRADRVEILPDMRGIVATFDKLRQPPGWQAPDKSGTETAWVWTSEGSGSPGQVLIFKPAETPKKSDAKALFSIVASVGRLKPDQNAKGAIDLTVQFDKKDGADLAPETFIEFEDVTLDLPTTAAANPGSPCLVTTASPWKITESCRVTVHFQGLNTGHLFEIKAYRAGDLSKGEPKKVYASTISVEIMPPG